MMNSPIFQVWTAVIFMSVVASVTSFQCYMCSEVADNPRACDNATVQECPPGAAYVCGTFIITSDATTFNTRSCIASEICFNGTLGAVGNSISTECCSTNLCNAVSSSSRLRCISCTDTGSTPCTTSITCPSKSDSCAIESTTVSGVTTITRRCLPQTSCTGIVGDTTIACCTTNNCNSGSGLAGLKCGSCFDSPSNPCTTSDLVTCPFGFDRCVKTTQTGIGFSSLDCSTSALCTPGNAFGLVTSCCATDGCNLDPEGSSLECYSCTDIGSTTCTSAITCPSGSDRCMSVTANGATTSTRSCSTSAACTQGIVSGVTTSCCPTNLCNFVSGGSSLRCYSCTDAGSTPCTTLASCAPQLDRCATITTTSAGLTTTSRSCWQRSSCLGNLGATTISCCTANDCNTGGGASGGSSLRCHTCTDTGTRTCTRSIACVFASELCAIISTTTSSGVVRTTRQCLAQTSCTGTVGDTTTTCCTTNDCNSGTGTTGDSNLRCFSCFDTASTPCIRSVVCPFGYNSCEKTSETNNGVTVAYRSCSASCIPRNNTGTGVTTTCCSTDLCNSDTGGSLQCYSCVDNGIPCTTTITCSTGLDRCSMVSTSGVTIRSCMANAQCSESPVAGTTKSCCPTNNCNSESDPNSGASTNALRCYECTDGATQCTTTATCSVGLDKCAMASYTMNGASMTQRLCVASTACDVPTTIDGIPTTPSCCNGPLCNSALNLHQHKIGLFSLGSLAAICIMKLVTC